MPRVPFTLRSRWCTLFNLLGVHSRWCTVVGLLSLWCTVVVVLCLVRVYCLVGVLLLLYSVLLVYCTRVLHISSCTLSRSCTVIGVLSHLCTLVGLLSRSCTVIGVLSHLCTLAGLLSRSCTLVVGMWHSYVYCFVGVPHTIETLHQRKPSWSSMSHWDLCTVSLVYCTRVVRISSWTAHEFVYCTVVRVLHIKMCTVWHGAIS